MDEGTGITPEDAPKLLPQEIKRNTDALPAPRLRGGAPVQFWLGRATTGDRRSGAAGRPSAGNVAGGAGALSLERRQSEFESGLADAFEISGCVERSMPIPLEYTHALR